MEILLQFSPLYLKPIDQARQLCRRLMHGRVVPLFERFGEITRGCG